MKKRECFKEIIVCLMLFAPMQTFALDFLGVKIGGSLDDISLKLEPKGFSPVKIIAKKGEFAGQEVVFGNETMRMLKGDICGFNVPIMLHAPDKASVNSITIEPLFTNEKDTRQFSSKLFEYIEDNYGVAKFVMIKEFASPETLKELEMSCEGNVPDMMVMWEFSNGSIYMDVDFSTYKVNCSFDN